MVQVRRASVGGDTILVGSDLTDLSAARQELRSWAHDNDLIFPRRPRRLTLTEGEQVLREFVVLEAPGDAPRAPRGNRFATSLRLVRATDGPDAA